MDYKSKLIIAGNVIELYQYEEEITRGFEEDENKTKRKVEKRKQNQKFMKEMDEWVRKNEKKLFRYMTRKEVGNLFIYNKMIDRREDNLDRAKKELRRLINANADILTKFVTLTFGEDVQDVDEANKRFTAFIKRLKRFDDTLQYVTVVEFTKKGRVHYHMLCNLKYIKKAKLQEIWGNGFVQINRIDRVDNVGAYVVKYMQKDMHDPRLREKKAYFRSRGLKKPVEITDNKKIQRYVETLDQKGIKPIYEVKFENEHCSGSYFQYNLKRKK